MGRYRLKKNANINFLIRKVIWYGSLVEFAETQNIVIEIVFQVTLICICDNGSATFVLAATDLNSWKG